MIYDITNYSSWCRHTWFIKDDKDTLFVCLAGFAGESGEIAEEILNKNKHNLLKECGDFFYYWVRLHQLFDYSIDTVNYDIPQPRPLAQICLDFHTQVGKVCEILKKHISYHMPVETRLKDTLQECLNTFLTLAYTEGYTLEDIIDTNIKKIEDRMLKGTLLGNGSDR